ncbi:diaminopimelate decarboxylase [Hazenella coriacea]|uniref:Diaminopimelate decarboxylase n=1 Tax=Hazenella coriacea TaxID=1179467 RepID=A0A4R3L3G0_9BACL|nr:diaminopimelate decarboxylase [Hazenella coriacea]TCS93458.1 diaminopimelate decarboxylase [Hazenella coriacea]
MFLHGTSRMNQREHLEIGGCDSVELVEKFGTPLYIIDEQLVRERMRQFVSSFQETGLAFQVGYASKAFSTLAMCRIVDEEGLLLDVVSEGELYTALKAGFPANRIYFHGNNKSLFEMEMALDVGIRLFVVDNFIELEMLDQLAKKKNRQAHILLRISPGIEAHTHAYIQTGQEDSKFGFDLGSGQALQATKRADQAESLLLLGFHCHIGSQIFDGIAFQLAIEKMVGLIHACYQDFGFVTQILNVGGGFGIRYEQKDTPNIPAHYVQTIAKAVRRAFSSFPSIPEIWIEPGRSIIGEAGTTLYTIGTTKEVPGIRKYVSIDGGMTDNPRPALYQAKYEAMLANRANEEIVETVSIAGKCCESGDMLIWNVKLPQVKQGDLLAVSCTGAYTFSMASNYNRLRRPAVVLVKDGEADLVVQRENFEDLISHDLIPDRLKK